MTDRAVRWTIGLCSIALLVPLALPLVTGRVFVMNDLGNFHLPLRYLYQNALKNGDSVLWTPALFAGFYVHGEGQLGMFHPLHLVLYWLFPLQIAFNLELLSSYLVAFAGTYWLLRRLALRSAAALFGAMLFTFCGFDLLHVIHMNMIAVCAHMPWLLGAIDVVLTADTGRRRAIGVLSVGLILTSELLLGFPQAVWWSVLTAGTFAIARAAELGRWRPLVWCVMAGACAALAGAIQLLPTADLAAHSTRALLPRDFALTYSLDPLNLLQLWSPYVFAESLAVNRVYDPVDYPWLHEFGVYCGAVSLLALAWLWTRRHALRDRRRLIVWASAFALLTFALTLGRFGGLDVLITYVPGLGSFRAPARYILLVQFSLAVLAAIAFEDLLDDRRGRVRLRSSALALLLLPLILAVLTTALVNGRLLDVPGPPIAPIRTAAVGVLVIASVTVLFLLAAGNRRWAPIALVVLTAADLGIWGINYVYREPARTIAEFAGPWPVPRERTRVDCAFDCDDRIVMRGYDLVEPYVALFPTTELPMDGEPFQRLAGVSRELLKDGEFLPRPDALPRARLLANTRASEDVATDIWDVDLEHAALVDAPPPALGGPPGSARLVEDRPGRIVVLTSSSGRQLLSIGERFHDGWNARIDGRDAQVIRVNGDFLGCVVEAGSHRVELRFLPRSFVLGAFISAGGLVCLALLAAFAGRQKQP
jgi:membrane protein YfhO